MTWRQFQEALREELGVQLEAKTGWGRVEIMQAFDRAVAEAVGRFVADE